MHFKLHNNSVLACCDEELIGKVFKKGNLEVAAKEEFYGKEEINEEKLKEMLKEYANINLLGRKAVKAALEEGIITEKGVIKIGKVPHAVIIKI